MFFPLRPGLARRHDTSQRRDVLGSMARGANFGRQRTLISHSMHSYVPLGNDERDVVPTSSVCHGAAVNYFSPSAHEGVR
jgi:hypothetical protein